MTAWTSDELKKIGAADELNLSSLRCNGTLRNPVTMWVVCVDDNLYMRAVKGRTGAWFRGVLTRHEGRIRSGRVEKDVLFVEEGAPILVNGSMPPTAKNTAATPKNMWMPV